MCSWKWVCCGLCCCFVKACTQNKFMWSTKVLQLVYGIFHTMPQVYCGNGSSLVKKNNSIKYEIRTARNNTDETKMKWINLHLTSLNKWYDYDESTFEIKSQLPVRTIFHFFNPSILKCVYLCDSNCMWIDFLSLKIQCKHVSIYLVYSMVYIYMCVRFFFSFHSIIHRFDSDTMRPWQTTYMYRMGVLDFIFSTDEVSIFDNSHLPFLRNSIFSICRAIVICSCISFKQINFVCMNCSI